jgi:pimeloyl-ACP methyl ester carboxylesterase
LPVEYARLVADGPLTIQLADGRRLESWSAGESGAPAVLLHMGTPGAGVPFAPLVDATLARGARFVTYSRPGYAGSTRLEGRSVSDCAADAAALLDALEVDRAHVVGWSGGGPHALACAALLPERVPSGATLAGVAPWGAAGLDWLEGMAQENLDEFAAVLEGPEALLRFLEPLVADRVDVTAETVAAGLGGLLTGVDRAALTGAFAEYLALAERTAVSSGPWGWLDDDLAFARDWGFALDDVRVPVTVWQGVHDAMVPTTHGEWLAGHVPGARRRILADEGHLSLVGRFGDVLDDLLGTDA